MAKKNRKPKTAKPPAPVFGAAGESPSVEILTIGWMLTFMVTAFADLAYLGAWMIARFGSEEPAEMLGAFSFIWHFTAIISGTLCLSLMSLVYRLRRLKPPRAIMVAAYIVALPPIALMILLGIMAPDPFFFLVPHAG